VPKYQTSEVPEFSNIIPSLTRKYRQDVDKLALTIYIFGSSLQVIHGTAAVESSPIGGTLCKKIRRPSVIPSTVADY
jgi:hypothetical protein